MEQVNSAQIIDNILDTLGIKHKEFIENVGIGRQTLRDIRTGTARSISKNLAEKIVTAYPQINEVHLLTGKGPLFLTDKKQQVQENIKADPMDVYVALANRVLNIERTQQEILQKQDMILQKIELILTLNNGQP